MSVYHCSAPFKGCCGNGWLPQLPPFPIPKRRFGSPCWPNPSNLRLPIAAKRLVNGKREKKREKEQRLVIWSHDCGRLKKYLKLKSLSKLWSVVGAITQTSPSLRTCLINYFILCLDIVNNVFWFIIFNFAFSLFFHLQFQFHYFFDNFLHPNPMGGNFNAYPILLHSRFAFDASFFLEIIFLFFIIIVIIFIWLDKL